MLWQKWPARLVSLSILIALFAAYTLSHAQGNNPSDPLGIVRVNTKNHPHIEVVVSALDTTGRPLSGLTKDNFVITEDGKQIPITGTQGITDESIPYAAVLLMDTSRSMTDDPLAKTKAAAIAFVNQLRPIDEVGLVQFSSTVKEVQPPTLDKAAVIKAINGLQAGGETKLYDALAQGVKTALKSKATRRAIILLTDGNQYGPSNTARNDSFQVADKAGIPVFTIGLGYSIDAPYLKDAAQATGGTFYASPRPDQLAGIYAQIGSTLRGLYLINFDTTLPADGTTHVIRVDLKVGSESASAATSARYPAPIPVVTFPGFDPTKPLDKPTAITPHVEADNTLTSYEYKIDGTTVATGSGSPRPVFVIPITLAPGKHNLSLSATDNQGNTGTGATDFQIAALPPQFTITSLKNNETLSADRKVSLSVTASQTAAGQAIFDVDGTPIATVAQSPYQATIKVLSLTPGPHTLNVQLKNQSATGKASVPFVVSPAPRQTATRQAIRQATLSRQQTLTAQPTNTLTSTPTSTPTNTATSTVTNTPLPTSTWTLTPIPVTSTPLPSNTAVPTTNTPRASNTAVPTITYTPPPSRTALPTTTNTPRPTITPVPSTNTPVPTLTLTPSKTNTPLPSDTPLPSATFTPSITYTPSNTNTPLPTATFTPSNTATATITDTPTATPSPTPVAPFNGLLSAASSPLGLLCGGLLLILIIVLVILLGGRRAGR